MASMTITFADDVANRIIDGLCAYGQYDNLPDPKPTKAAFGKQTVIHFMETVTKNYEADLAAKEAHTAAKEQAEEDIILS